MSGAADVVVIGGGVMGGWTALRARESGLATTLIDAWAPGHARATSGGDARIHRLGYVREEWSRSSVSARADWLAFCEETGEELFIEAGVLIMLPELDDRLLTTMDACAVPYEILAPDDVRERWPALGVEETTTTIFEPTGGVLRAKRAVEAVARTFQRKGGAFELGHVRPGRAQGRTLLDVVADGTGARTAGETFVFACGPWLAQLFPDAVGDLLNVTKQDVCFFGSPPGDARYTVPQLPAYIDDVLGYDGVPALDGRGLKTQPERRGPVWDPSEGERIPDPDSMMAARRYVAARFPGLADQPIEESQVCQGDRTPDLEWIIDRHPDYDNVWLVGGGSSRGYKHGPQIGSYVVSKVTGARSEVDDLYALARFSEVAPV